MLPYSSASIPVKEKSVENLSREVFYAPRSEMLHIAAIPSFDKNSVTWLHFSIRQSAKCHLAVCPGEGGKAFADHLEVFTAASIPSIRISSKTAFTGNLTRSQDGWVIDM